MPLTKLSPAEQSSYLQLVLDSTVEGFYAVDTTGQTTLCNAAFLQMLGYETAGEVIGQRLHNTIHHSHPDGSPYAVGDCPIYLAASAGKPAHVTDEVFFRRDGTSFPVEYRAVPIYRDGVLHGAVCTFVDITERITQNSQIIALKAEAERVAEILQLAQEVGGIGVFSVALETDEVTVTPQFCRTLGLPLTSRMTGEQATSTILEEDRAIQSNATTRRDGTAALNVEYRIRRPDTGEIRWITRHAEFIHDDQGKPVQMIGVLQDITERKRVDLTLSESRAHLNLMVESAQDYAIISIDLDGIIISWNIGAERIFGFTPEEIIGQPAAKIFTPEDRDIGVPRHEMQTAARLGRASDERWHLRANGERFYVSGIMTAMLDDKGAVRGFVKIARDMTAQQEAQESLLQARNAAEAANIAKTEFLANMSHEIRTPMNAIIGLANILANSHPLSEKQKQFVKTLQLSADSLLGLINDLLDISKIEARTIDLEQIPFSLTQLLQEVVSMMAVRVKEKNLTFTGEGEDVSRRMFVGDPTRLRQIILNLCSNAIKFTHEGGVHIAVTSEEMQSPDIETICIAITDTGIGIAPGKQEMIFAKFVQADTSINRRYGGTGLGLAITKTLVEIMGGTISVASQEGHGSTFKVCIPLRLATAQEAVDENHSLSAIIHTSLNKEIKPRILVVEDYAPNILVAQTVLEQFGYESDVATSGIEAFEAIKGNAYALVLMDVQMHGMNGLEATRMIRAHERQNDLPNVVIIGMTAHALAGDRERCLSVGMDDYLSKPFNPNDLREKLEQYLTVKAE